MADTFGGSSSIPEVSETYLLLVLLVRNARSIVGVPVVGNIAAGLSFMGSQVPGISLYSWNLGESPPFECQELWLEVLHVSNNAGEIWNHK